MGLKSLSGYAPLLKEIKERIREAQYAAHKAGNKEAEKRNALAEESVGPEMLSPGGLRCYYTISGVLSSASAS